MRCEIRKGAPIRREPGKLIAALASGRFRHFALQLPGPSEKVCLAHHCASSARSGGQGKVFEAWRTNEAVSRAWLLDRRPAQPGPSLRFRMRAARKKLALRKRVPSTMFQVADLVCAGEVNYGLP